MAQPYDIPHLAFPIRFTGHHYATDYQGSLDEATTAVRNICAFELGTRIERPDFGIKDQTLQAQPIDVGQVADAIATWEPRVSAEIQVSMTPDGKQTLDITISLPLIEDE